MGSSYVLLGGSGDNEGPRLGKSVGDSHLGRDSSRPASSSTVARSFSCEDIDALVDLFP